MLSSNSLETGNLAVVMGPLEGVQDVLGVSQSTATTRAKDQGAVISCLAAAAAKLLQSCPTLCDPIEGRPPGSTVPGILQARTLEWVAISFSNA